MKNKYSMKLIWDYVNGKKINNVDELEKDYVFMMQVIRVTRDKKIYNLCSDNIKNNYEFVKFIINIFKNDVSFIAKVAKEYLNNTSFDDLSHQELIFILADILNDDSKVSLLYNLKRIAIYNVNRLLIELQIQNEYDYDLKVEYGLGFILAKTSKIGNSNIILKYFAKRYIEEIFYSNTFYDLEELIHKEIVNFDKIKEQGIKKFILNYIARYDENLAQFLHNNIDLIIELEQDIIKIGNNWNNYIEMIENRKKYIFFQEVNNLINKYNALFSYEDVIIYIDKLQIIKKKLSTCSTTSNSLIDIKNIDLNSYSCLKEIIKFSKELYSSPIIELNQNHSSSQKNTKILKFSLPKKEDD